MQNARPGQGAGVPENWEAEHSNFTATPPAPQADLTESGLADTFVALVAQRVRYCAERKWWMRLSADGWAIDTSDATFNECRQLLRQIARNCAHVEAQRLGRLSTINAVLRIARTDRALAVTTLAAVALFKDTAGQ